MAELLPAIDLDSFVEDNPYNRWGGGVVLPSVLLLLSAPILWHQRTFFYLGKHNTVPVTLTGFDAVVAALCILFPALYLHCHFFWSLNERLNPYAFAGKLLSALGFAVSVAYTAFAAVRYAFLH